MKVSVIGVGYVGLVSGACLADVGNHVTCVDIDENKIKDLSDGKLPIHEAGLEQVVATNLLVKRLGFTSSVERGIRGAEVIFIAVGTPQMEDGSADLGHVLTAARSIAQWLKDYSVVVVKSTVPVGSCDAVRDEIDGVLAQRNCSVEFDVVSNPEFLKEGAAVSDFLKPDRIVIGSDSLRAKEKMDRLYSPFNRSNNRMLFMDVRSAELTKYAANAMLATKISFINEIANLSDRVGADIESVRLGIGSDPRIGYDFIYPGCGYGGSCFPKDVRALYQIGKAHQYDSRLLRAVDEVNTAQKRVLVRKYYASMEMISKDCISHCGVLHLSRIQTICGRHQVNRSLNNFSQMDLRFAPMIQYALPLPRRFSETTQQSPFPLTLTAH